jgi:surface carbohydrate biosynthesis protein
MNDNKKTIYIAIEIKAREFLSHIVLSILAIKNNYRVIIGSQSSIIEYILKKPSFGGILLHKGGIHENTIEDVKKKINSYAVLDQEVVPGWNKKFYERIIPDRYHIKTQKKIDLYLASNKIISKIAKKTLYYIKNKIFFVGMPSFDLCRPKYFNLHKNKILEIKKKYNNFILFNSNFGSITPLGINQRLEYLPWGRKKKNMKKFISEEKIKYKDDFDDFNVTCKFLKEIALLTKKKIIIRPHPAESIMAWNHKFKNCQNIYVEKPIDSVIPWIYACNGLLHRGCSTSYFGYLINKPIGVLKIFKSSIILPQYKELLAEKISRKIYNSKDFINWLNENKFNNKINIYENLGFEKKAESVDKIINLFNKTKTDPEYSYNILNRRNNYFLHYYLIIKHNILKNLIIFLTRVYLLKKNINKYEITPKIGEGIKSTEIKKIFNVTKNKFKKIKQIGLNLVEII